MKQYLYTALTCIIIAIIAAIIAVFFIGCTKASYRPDCSSHAVNRALVAGVEDTRTVMGSTSRTPVHVEAQKEIKGHWNILRIFRISILDIEWKGGISWENGKRLFPLHWA